MLVGALLEGEEKVLVARGHGRCERVRKGGGGSVSGSGERGCEGVREGEGVVRRGVRGDERVRGE